MDVMMIVIIVLVGFVILVIGGGIFYFIWIASRPKKMTWNAMVYQLGDGEVRHDEKGNKINKYILGELKPYAEDIIEKVDKKNGATHYWLQRMKKAVPVVTADCVEVWAPNKKFVKVLLEEDTCTLIKSGYDKRWTRW